MNKYQTGSPWDFISIRQLDKYMIGHKGYIAGGCFRNIFNKEPIRDIDIFFNTKEAYDEANNYYKNLDDYRDYYNNDKVTAYINKHTHVVVELIKYKFSTPKEMLEEFDFTITKFAYYKHYLDEDEIWYDENKNPTKILEYRIIYHKDMFTHLHLKRIVIDKEATELTLPISTYNRAFKYARYGYYPCRNTKIKMLDAIRKVEGGTEELLALGLYDGLD